MFLDDVIAFFLSEGGELVTGLSCNEIDVYFTKPKLASFFGLEYEKCLCWWYVSDSFHCGKRLKEDYYRPIMSETIKGGIEQEKGNNVRCGPGEITIVEDDMHTGDSFAEKDQNTIADIQMCGQNFGREGSKPKFQVASNDELGQLNESHFANPMEGRLYHSKVTYEKEDKQLFYLHPEDEGVILLKSKLRSQNIPVIDEFPLKDSQNIDDTLIIISYKHHSYISKYPRVYTPFYLARILDLEENKGKAILKMPQTEFSILDKPCPVDPIEPKLEISISGFVGQQRTVVQLLIQLTGSRYNDHLSPAIDVLVTPFKSIGTNEPIKQTKKEEAANIWKIPVVNLNWLEESFKIWRWASK